VAIVLRRATDRARTGLRAFDCQFNDRSPVVHLPTGMCWLNSLPRSARQGAVEAAFGSCRQPSSLALRSRSGLSIAAAIPVLHVSATATGPDDRSTGLIRGADGYLVDPIERDELLVTVIALLRYNDARRASDRLAARLEQLHQTTPLINAALTVTDLTRFASTGARRSPPHGANWSARSCS
jgi:hypothetical protein